MSTITIKDLSESTDLDRKAMLAIVGGARRGGYPVALASGPASGFRLFQYPTGLRHIPSAVGNSRSK